MPTPHARAATFGTADESQQPLSPAKLDANATAASAPTARPSRKMRKPSSNGAAKARPDKGTATMRRVPRQERSKILVDCIRIAAKDILQKRGPKALTTNNIAARAGVSIGSLYQYFANKEEILEEVFREEADQTFEDSRQWADWVKNLPLRDVIRLVIERAVRRHREFHSFHPDFYQRHHRELHVGLRSTEATTDQGEPYAVAWLREVFAGREAELRVRDPRLAAITLAHGMSQTLSGLVDSDPTLLYDDALGAKLTEVFSGMLLRDVA